MYIWECLKLEEWLRSLFMRGERIDNAIHHKQGEWPFRKNSWVGFTLSVVPGTWPWQDVVLTSWVGAEQDPKAVALLCFQVQSCYWSMPMCMCVCRRAEHPVLLCSFSLSFKNILAAVVPGLYFHWVVLSHLDHLGHVTTIRSRSILIFKYLL